MITEYEVEQIAKSMARKLELNDDFAVVFSKMGTVGIGGYMSASSTDIRVIEIGLPISLFTEMEWAAILAHELGHIKLRHEYSGHAEEYEADEFAAGLVGVKETVSALTKTMNFRYVGESSTHPAMEKRIARLARLANDR